MLQEEIDYQPLVEDSPTNQDLRGNLGIISV